MPHLEGDVPRLGLRAKGEERRHGRRAPVRHRGGVPAGSREDEAAIGPNPSGVSRRSIRGGTLGSSGRGEEGTESGERAA